MRSSLMLAGYAFCLGWYVRYTGLDEDVAQICRDGWDTLVTRTTLTARAAAARAALAEHRHGQQLPLDPEPEPSS